MKSFCTKIPTNWPVYVFILAVLVLWSKHAQWAFWYLNSYQEYCVSDWLINYRGGFVRRGFLGQLFWDAFRIFPFDVRKFILSLPFIFSPILLIILLKIFHQRRWSPIVLFTFCCFGATFFSPNIRRDYWVLIMVFAIFFMASRWISNRRRIFLWGYLLLSTLTIISYEPVIFIFLPIFFFVIKKRLLVWLLTPVVFATFLSKGNAETAQVIWQSWEPLFEAYPAGDDNNMGLGVEALGWRLLPTMLFHLRMAYIGLKPSFMTLPLTIYLLAGTYYLMTHFSVVRFPIWKTHPYSDRALSNVLIFQTLSMLPMFTILSCDWGRNITLTCISTFLLLHFFPNAPRSMPRIDRISNGLLTIIDRYKIFKSPCFYIFVALTIPVPLSEAPHLGDSLLGIFVSLFFQL